MRRHPCGNEAPIYTYIHSSPRCSLGGGLGVSPKSPQNIIPPIFLYLGDAGGAIGDSLSRGVYPDGRCCRVALGPYNSHSCAGGPIRIHSETEGSPFLKGNMYGAAPISLGGACIMSSCTAPKIYRMGGSERTCSPEMWWILIPIYTLHGGFPPAPPSLH